MIAAVLLGGLMTTTPGPVDRSITVNGDAEVRIAPDQVQLMLGVVTVDKNVSKAKTANDERVAKTLAVLQKGGVAAKDLQTDQLSIEPVSDSGYSRVRDPDGYQVRRSIVVMLRDVTKFEALLTSVIEAGANQVDGISFQTSELRKHRDAARAMALKAAKEKAEGMAKEYGLKVGKARSISESSSWWGSPVMRAGGFAQNMVQNVGGGGEPSDTFAAGMISVRATVNVAFDLE